MRLEFNPHQLKIFNMQGINNSQTQKDLSDHTVVLVDFMQIFNSKKVFPLQKIFRTETTIFHFCFSVCFLILLKVAHIDIPTCILEIKKRTQTKMKLFDSRI